MLHTQLASPLVQPDVIAVSWVENRMMVDRLVINHYTFERLYLLLVYRLS